MSFFKRIYKNNSELVNVPVSGETVPIEEVPDKVFAQKMMGDGFAVIPNIGEIYSPISGVVTFIAETSHGIGIKTKEGLELIIHLGIDTVTLNGKPFDINVVKGQKVKQDQKIGSMNISMIKQANLNPIVIVAITNMDKNQKIENKNYGECKKGFSALEMN